MNKLRLLVSFVMGVVAAPLALHAAADPSNSQNTQSPATVEATNAQKVLADLHHANLMEIKMGELAKKRGHLAAVKEFGDKLVKDHQDADSKVTTLAKSQNIQLTDAEMASGDAMADLKSLKGTAFDRAFAKQMVDDHHKSIGMLQAAQSKISGTPTGDLVSQVLPVIQEHERIAVDLVSQIDLAQKQKS